jgi:hypothetical protein
MRRIVAVFLVGMAATASGQQPDLKMFSWLAGVWEMTDGSRIVEEQWTAPTANAMIGMSRTVAGDRTTEFEFLRIEQRGGDIFYVPQPGGRPPVAFRLASSDGGRYIFENTTGEDRVKRIEYRRESDDGLYARVEGVQGGGSPFALEYRYRRRK